MSLMSPNHVTNLQYLENIYQFIRSFQMFCF